MTNAPEDRHVAALAATAADAIVTANLRDFPSASLAQYHVIVQSPDEFLVNLWDANPGRIERVVAEQAASYRRPAMTLDHLLDRLAVHAPSLVQRLRNR
jgi:sarcosine oxidase gamma subunit